MPVSLLWVYVMWLTKRQNATLLVLLAFKPDLNKHKLIINKSNIQSWFAQQLAALALYLKSYENG
jgi:hypothetical protein